MKTPLHMSVRVLMLALSVSAAAPVAPVFAASSTEQNVSLQAQAEEKVQQGREMATRALEAAGEQRQVLVDKLSQAMEDYSLSERLAMMEDVINNIDTEKAIGMTSTQTYSAVGALLALGLVHKAHRAKKNGKALVIGTLSAAVLAGVNIQNDPELRQKFDGVVDELKSLRDATAAEIRARAL